MAYITIADLSARLGAALYGRLTDRVNGTTADAVVAQQIVDEAEAAADSLLARRYATPIDLTAHPQAATVLKSRVLDLAEHLAWRGSPFVNDMPQRVRGLNGAAMDWFEAVAAARVLLPVLAPPASTSAAQTGPLISAPPRTLTTGELDGL